MSGYHTWFLLGRLQLLSWFWRRHEYVAHLLRRLTVSLGLIFKVSFPNQVILFGHGIYTCLNPVSSMSFLGSFVFLDKSREWATVASKVR